MSQSIQQSFAHFFLCAFAVAGMALSSCSNDKSSFNFKTADDAVNACRKELSDIKGMKNPDIKTLAKAMSRWMELQDSVVSFAMRDSNQVDNSLMNNVFISVVDSVRTELFTLATATKRTMPEVVTLKVATARDRKKITSSEDFKKACDFFRSLDDATLYQSLETTLSEYEKILTNPEPFTKEKQLHDFIRKEDRCFRSLLARLTLVPQDKLQMITDETSALFDALYSSTMADMDNRVNERVMMWLTMRFNRRIIQNAEVCRNDIKAGKKLSDQTAANYRWMILQPFMTIDNYSVATLTEGQVKQLTTLAEELPELLSYCDGKDYEKSTPEERSKLSDVLTQYFLKSYLRSTL